MARGNIRPISTDEALIRQLNRLQVSQTTPVVPATYTGKYVHAVLVATDAELTEAQMDALETAIEAINGVFKAHLLIGSREIPVAEVPTGYDLRLRVEAGWDVTPEPVV